MTGELAHYWQHPSVPDVDLLRASFVTHRFGRHVHEGYTIGVIERGVEEFDTAGSTQRAGAGSIVIVNPQTVHTGHAGVPEGWSYRAMYPSIELAEEIAVELGGRGGTPYFPAAVVSDPSCARLLGAAHRAAESGDALASSSLLRASLGGLLRRHAGRPPRALDPGLPSRAVRDARDLLHARLIDPPSLDELAETVGAAPFALLRAFRAATGLPPHAYLNHVRVQKARALLDTGVRPAEVAARTGFTDQSHLTRHFKRSLGVPPRTYQKARPTP